MKANVKPQRPQSRGLAAVWQARLAMLVMINVAQLWILSAAVEAALAHAVHSTGSARHCLRYMLADRT
ncbi:MAG: hypothetical protein IPG58_19585 [Acidobacteria bacterium]|nr:hypothetical protein [Acidobacteriota bacterium]